MTQGTSQPNLQSKTRATAQCIFQVAGLSFLSYNFAFSFWLCFTFSCIKRERTMNWTPAQNFNFWLMQVPEKDLHVFFMTNFSLFFNIICVTLFIFAIKDLISVYLMTLLAHSPHEFPLAAKSWQVTGRKRTYFSLCWFCNCTSPAIFSFCCIH